MRWICSLGTTLPSMLAGAGPQAGGQEATGKLADFAASVKGFMFYTTTFLLALPLFAIMLLLTPFMLLFDKHRRLAQHFVNNIWAKISTLLYYRVQVLSFFQAPETLVITTDKAGPGHIAACWALEMRATSEQLGHYHRHCQVCRRHIWGLLVTRHA